MQYDPDAVRYNQSIQSIFVERGNRFMNGKNGENGRLLLRAAVPDDAAVLLAIYAPYVKDTAITFEYDIPSEEEFRSRITHTLEKYPYIVAEADGILVGYAYAGPFKARAAYSWDVEMTVYVDRSKKRGGVGTSLYRTLEAVLAAQGIVNAEACITYPKDGMPDEYLTCDSPEFHKYMGYRLVGEFRSCGYKFGRWYNMIWMEKFLGEHPDNGMLQPVKPFAEIADSLLPVVI